MKRHRLLFLHTGGTLGMIQRKPGPLEPAFYDQAVLPFVAGLEAVAEIEGRVVCSIDSTDMSPEIWEELGRLIAENIDAYDGFVVLHGTDTMAWTAAALSFMLRGLPKTVVVTGSQRPIAELRTDARSNLVHSTICATLGLPEVGLYFGSHLYRGNRATKVSIQDYDAFASPNHAPLVSMGVDVVAGPSLPAPVEPFSFQPGFSRDVLVLSLFPGMGAEILPRLVDSGVRAVILRGFGEGNLPHAGWPDAIEAATAAGVSIVVTSQCARGSVLPGRYDCSAVAAQRGAFFAGDMTTEATTVKVMWLIGQGADRAELGRRLLTPLAGECADRG